MFWPCETRTSTCRSFATISSGLYRFLAIAVLLDVKDIPQVGPLQWGWITAARRENTQHYKGDPIHSMRPHPVADAPSARSWPVNNVLVRADAVAPSTGTHIRRP